MGKNDFSQKCCSEQKSMRTEGPHLPFKVKVRESEERSLKCCWMIIFMKTCRSRQPHKNVDFDRKILLDSSCSQRENLSLISLKTKLGQKWIFQFHIQYLFISNAFNFHDLNKNNSFWMLRNSRSLKTYFFFNKKKKPKDLWFVNSRLCLRTGFSFKWKSCSQ